MSHLCAEGDCSDLKLLEQQQQNNRYTCESLNNVDIVVHQC